MLIERKGYTGGTVTEGGTALHSFYNLWKAFPGVKKRQVVQGIPQQIVDRLMAVGACSGHAEMVRGYDYDSVCTAIDTELYKLVTMQMLDEAGVFIAVNTLLTGAIMDGGRLRGAIVDSRPITKSPTIIPAAIALAWPTWTWTDTLRISKPTAGPISLPTAYAAVSPGKLYVSTAAWEASSVLRPGRSACPR
jgi:hypothetical protein